MMIRQDISQFLPRELMITKPISKYIIWRLLVPFVSYLILIGPLASGLSFRVNHMEEVFAALPAPIIVG